MTGWWIHFNIWGDYGCNLLWIKTLPKLLAMTEACNFLAVLWSRPGPCGTIAWHLCPATLHSNSLSVGARLHGRHVLAPTHEWLHLPFSSCRCLIITCLSPDFTGSSMAMYYETRRAWRVAHRRWVSFLKYRWAPVTKLSTSPPWNQQSWLCLWWVSCVLSICTPLTLNQNPLWHSL